MYLDRFYTRTKNKNSLSKVSFDLYINEFIIPLKDNLYSVLSNYFKELENLDNDENVIKIKKIIKIINVDNIKNPKIVKKVVRCPVAYRPVYWTASRMMIARLDPRMISR